MTRLTTILLSLLLYASAVDAKPDLVSAGFQAFKEQRWSEAYEYWIPEADKGNARAQFYLSILFEEGLSVEEDAVTSLTLLMLAAEGGFAPAQFRLGTHYQFGYWVEKDMGHAIDWWLKAADKGFVKAQLNLASVYYLGNGTEANLQKSIEWFRRAALNGSVQASNTLERMGVDLVPLDATNSSSTDTIAGEHEDVTQLVKESLLPSQEVYGYQEDLDRYKSKSDIFLISPIKSISAAAPVIVSKPPTLKTGPQAEQDLSPINQVDVMLAPAAGISAPVKNEDLSPFSLWALAKVDKAEQEWIERQPLDNYTLQLFSSNKYESARRFVKTLKTRRLKAIYPFGKPENIWYGVIVGSYFTKLELRQAQNELVNNGEGKNPWIRKFEEIRRGGSGN